MLAYYIQAPLNFISRNSYIKKTTILFVSFIFSSSFVFAQKTYVPDDKFEQALIALGYDTTLDDSVLTANISGVTELDVSKREISDLTGIEDFAALGYLMCYSNQLTSLDMSKNTVLYALWCSDNQLTSLDVSKNTALTGLWCDGNQLTSLDVTKNTVLDRFWCSYNQLTSLDVSKNTSLTSLLCTSNQLTSLDVSKNTALMTLRCNSNQLTSLDVSKNTTLYALDCGSNQLTSLDVSKNTVLEYLGCYSNQLTSLDVSKNTALTDLDCGSNQLTSLDVTNNTALEYLDCNNNQLTSLDVSNNTALDALRCWNNQLTSLDVTNNTALEDLECSDNQLTSLDVSKNTALEYLDCNNNQLTSLDVSKNTALITLYCSSNQLTSLDVTKNTALDRFWCNSNQLTSLDVRKNTALKELRCNFNQLTSLDVSKNTALTWLYCHNNQLTSLDVSKNTALYLLVCHNNQLTRLDLRNGTNSLKGLDAVINPDLTCILVNDPNLITNWSNPAHTGYVDPFTTFSLSCMESFEWESTVLDTIIITTDNIDTGTYELKWTESADSGDVDYLIYAQVGVYLAELKYDTTATTFKITYDDIYKNTFQMLYGFIVERPFEAATVKFSVVATDGFDTVKVNGDDRVVYINRYEYLNIEDEGVPTEFALHDNYPNPFNPTTTLRFDLPEISDITLTIYNMLGQKVKTFNMQGTPAGYHRITWDATNDLGDPVGAGVYIYQLYAKDLVKTKKMVLLK